MGQTDITGAQKVIQQPGIPSYMPSSGYDWNAWTIYILDVEESNIATCKKKTQRNPSVFQTKDLKFSSMCMKTSVVFVENM